MENITPKQREILVTENSMSTLCTLSQYKITKPVFPLLVGGDSMDPTYKRGDILMCREISDLFFFQWGKVYAIDTSQGVIIKRIRKHINPEYVTCCSDDSEKFPPFHVPLSDIRRVGVVLGLLRTE